VARRPRYAPAGCFFHVTNRGNDRRRIFFTDADYRSFLYRLEFAKRRYAVKVLGLCIMPNHFHAILLPEESGALSAYLQWVAGNYAGDLRALTGTSGQGHIFQGRFWSDRIADERHFLSVLRYVEANPVEGRLVRRAEEWPWSSLKLRSDRNVLLDPLPLPLPMDWVTLVNKPQPRKEVDRIEQPSKRGRAANNSTGVDVTAGQPLRK
jgi:putative transposase